MKELSEEFLRAEYVEKNRSLTSNCGETGQSIYVVKHAIMALGIPIRSRHRTGRRNNLVGLIRGRLTVREFSHYCPKEEKTFWKCECRCGNFCLKRSNELTNKDLGLYASCDKCPREASENLVIPQSFLTRLIKNATYRGIDVSITLQDLEEVYLEQKGKCALSGIELATKATRNLLKCTASVDRKDPERGYHRDNIQFVHRVINFMKHTLQDEAFIKLCHAVASNHPTVTKAGPEDVSVIKMNKKRKIALPV